MTPTLPAPQPKTPAPGAPGRSATREIALADPAATDALGAALAGALGPGDTALLSGPIGAGKSHLARALIQSAHRDAGLAAPDVPSPTYTLVQPYPLPGGEILHADLYRLGDPGEIAELGLTEAFGRALCLVEWPDRLGDDAPADALRIDLAHAGEGRHARVSGDHARWAACLRVLDLAGPDHPGEGT